MALIDEVKSRSDIIQVISDYVDLDIASRQPKALCPFHSERTPSFIVYPDRGYWRCFGSCAEGGDVISFVMKRENMSFIEALENLAIRAGIKIQDRKNEPRKKPIIGLIEANHSAAEYFLSRLKSPAGEKTREYLVGRGSDIDTASRRGLGLAPDGMETLSGHLRTRNVQARSARDAGLITRKTDGSWSDMFTGRLTIEIRDDRDRIIGFGARTLDGSEPKYLNTPQTDAFDKSSILYGLNWAKESIRTMNEVIVVEGYMDVIAAHEHGFTNVVASMGTAITGPQLYALARHVTAGATGPIVLCLDSDAAGQAATMRTLETITEELSIRRRRGIEVKVARSDGGKDPDEAIRANPDDWRASLDKADSLLDFLIIAKSKLHNMESGQGIADFANSVAPLIYNIPNDYDQDRYWSATAELAGVTEERLKTIVDKPKPGIPGRIDPSQVSDVLEEGDPLEEHLLSLVLQMDDLREHVVSMSAEVFREPDNRALFTVWQASSKLDRVSGELGEEITEKIQSLTERLLPPSDQARHVEDVAQCVQRLKERHYRHIKKLESERLQHLEGDEARDLVDRSLHSHENLRKVMTGQT